MAVLVNAIPEDLLTLLVYHVCIIEKEDFLLSGYARSCLTKYFDLITVI
jgi:hypothetical protein